MKSSPTYEDSYAGIPLWDLGCSLSPYLLSFYFARVFSAYSVLQNKVYVRKYFHKHYYFFPLVEPLAEHLDIHARRN